MTVTTDVDAVNAVANDPDVRPWIGGIGPVDLAPLLQSPGTVTLWMDGGGFICHRIADRVFDVHSLFLMRVRHLTRRAMMLGCSYMFEMGPDALELVTTVPDDNAPAKALVQLAGFTLAGARMRCWPVMGGPLGVTWWRLTREEWAIRHGGD